MLEKGKILCFKFPGFMGMVYRLNPSTISGKIWEPEHKIFSFRYLCGKMSKAVKPEVYGLVR